MARGAWHFGAVPKGRLRDAAQAHGSLVVFGWCLVTLVIGNAPSIGFRRLVLTFLTFYIIFYSVNIIGDKKSLGVLAGVLIFLAMASLVSGVLIDNARHLSTDPEAATIGSWRGVFPHKNHAGLNIASGFIVSVIMYSCNRSRTMLLVTLCVGCMLILTQSKTSLGLALLALGIFSLVNFLKGKIEVKQRSIIWIGVFFVVLTIFLSQLDRLFVLLSDPTALTGRAFIWDALVQLFYESPITGHGFQSVYNVGIHSPLLKYLSNTWAEAIPHGHNGYLDLLVSTGVVGFIFTITAFVIFPLINIIKNFDDLGAKCCFGLIVFLTFHNFMETSILDRLRQGWILISFVYAYSYLLYKRSPPSSLDVSRVVNT